MIARSLALSLLAATAAVRAQATAELVGLINLYRTTAQTCDGVPAPPAGPLAPNAQLDRAPPPGDVRLLDALKARGYQGAAAQSISVSGPTRAADVMAFIRQRYCRPLTSPQFTDIGVEKSGTNWHVILARRLLSPDLGDWRDAGAEVLRMTNAARARGGMCGNREYGPAPPLAWNAKLGAAALAHSRDMATRNYFAHAAGDGTRADARASRQGYAWREIGENIAAGQGSPQQVMAGWLASPEHCANILNGRFTEVGAAYSVDPKSDATIYWTQVFGAPR